MLYLSQPTEAQSPETERALHAADGYLYFGLLNEALMEIEKVPLEEKELSVVMLARNRRLLHKKEWRKAEQISKEGIMKHSEEGEFYVQQSFAWHRLGDSKRAEQALAAAPDWIKRTGILLYNLACYEARLGDATHAKHIIAKAIEMNTGIKKSAHMDPDLMVLWQ